MPGGSSSRRHWHSPNSFGFGHEDGYRPVYTALFGADIPIVAHVTGLDQLPRLGFRFVAVPAKVRNFGTFPVRAFAEIDVES